MPKIINQLNRSLDHETRRSLSDRAAIVPKCRLSTFGLLFIFSLFILQCGFDIEDSTPPSSPVWVQKSLPEDWPERGIDAHESGGIYLEWEPSPSGETLTYHIYRAQWFDENDSLGDYNLVALIHNETISEFNHVDHQVGLAQYYYRLQSKDKSENISEYSDALTYMLLRSIDSETMIPNGRSVALPEDRTLRWQYYDGGEMEAYCITILSDENEVIYRAVFVPQNYIGRSESWQIPPSIQLKSNMVYKWRIDMIARFVDGLETFGSESAWAKFVYSEQ